MDRKIPVQKLEQIERIRQLKARYFRTLDTNDWAAFADCLTEDCQASYSDGKYAFSDRDAIVKFMSGSMSGPGLLTMHNGHHPEIEIGEDGRTATGIWYLQDLVIHLESKTRLYGAAIYSDRYTLEDDDQWRISAISYSRTFECVEPLPEGHRVLQNLFA